MPLSKYILLIFAVTGLLQATVWHSDAIYAAGALEKNDAVYCLFNDTVFPDSLCLAMMISPTYRGYDVKEGLLYAGFRNISVKLAAQQHLLMGNYRLDAGICILKEAHIHAALRLHYIYSAIRGYEKKQGFSCSGAFRLMPERHWEISVSSRHFLRLPEAICEQVSESRIRCDFLYKPADYITTGYTLQKRAGFSWQRLLHISASYREYITGMLQFTYPESELQIMLQLGLGRWRVMECLRMHPQLGFSHTAGIAYVY